ncbi:MAG: M20/M25/M40 family metallo-hydrolase, partial [Gemmatimonadales bacterium]
VMGYDSTVARIPTAAITVEDAEMLHRMQDRRERIVVRLTMEARMLPDTPSRNAVAEVVGSERPDEVVVLGGHIDSWDVGQGAMDDGGGAVAAWEAVKLIHDLGLHPRRTVRVVLWTNEENGQRGAIGYRDAHAEAAGRHSLAMESDGGVFKPVGFRFTGSDSALAVLGQASALLEGIGAGRLQKGEGDTDIGPLLELGVPGLSLDVEDSRYFWFHHTNGDTLDKLDPREMALCVATMAVMVYVVADLPDLLPR